MSSSEEPQVRKAVSNKFDVPAVPLPIPETPDIITQNAISLAGGAQNPRTKFIFENLTRHLHAFVRETAITTEEWETAIKFLTETGQTCTPLRQEFILLSDVFGVSALVDALNNVPVNGATDSSVLGPFFVDDAHDIPFGESIASEGKGAYLYVEGRVTDTQGRALADTTIETWETDENGFYDTQYADRDHPDCRGRVRTDAHGRFGYRAVVPVAYPIPADGPVGGLLDTMQRHNNRPAHLHMMFQTPGYARLVTALYPAGDKYLASDPVFGVKKSLVVDLQTITSDAEARKRGFPKGGPFQLLRRDIVMRTEAEAAAARAQVVKEGAAQVGAAL